MLITKRAKDFLSWNVSEIYKKLDFAATGDVEKWNLCTRNLP